MENDFDPSTIRVRLNAAATQKLFGERCEDFVPGCACCRAWRRHDRGLETSFTVDTDDLVAFIEQQ